MSQLLGGIRVIELTTGAAGPTVARVLCEFGAEVIRCETRLRGDGHRGEDPKLWNKKPDFMKLQRGKKSFTVNMQTAKGRELVKELVKKSDVLVENFGLGILEKWGLDWPDLQMINPRMILIRVKGMGCSGPHAADLTYGPNVGNTMARPVCGTTRVHHGDRRTAHAASRLHGRRHRRLRRRPRFDGTKKDRPWPVDRQRPARDRAARSDQDIWNTR
jgi:hypothetical protein